MTQAAKMLALATQLGNDVRALKIVGSGTFAEMLAAPVRYVLWYVLDGDYQGIWARHQDRSWEYQGHLTATNAWQYTCNSKNEIAGIENPDSSKHAVLLWFGELFEYRWDAADHSAKVTADTRKGATIPPTSDTTGASGAWLLVEDDGVNYKAFLETTQTPTENSLAINAALAICKNVQLGTGTVIGDAPLDIGTGCTLKGNGSGQVASALTVYQYDGADIAIKVSQNPSVVRASCLKNFTVKCTDDAASGIEYKGCRESVTERVSVYGSGVTSTGYGMRIHGGAGYGTYINRMMFCETGGFLDGVWVDGDETDSNLKRANNITIWGHRSDSNARCGYSFHECTAVDLYGCHAETNDIGIRVDSCFGVRMHGGYLENTTVDAQTIGTDFSSSGKYLWLSGTRHSTAKIDGTGVREIFSSMLEIEQETFASPPDIEIAAGVLTLPEFKQRTATVIVRPEATGGPDDLTSIVCSQVGLILTIATVASGSSFHVVVKDGAGMFLSSAGDFTLNHKNDSITLRCVGVNQFAEITRSDNP